MSKDKSNDILRTIMPIAGWPAARADQPTFTGGNDPFLPTSFRIGNSAAAALAAIGLAVSDIWELRTGRGQTVAVDARQATASLRSGKYMKLDGAAISTERKHGDGHLPDQKMAAGVTSTAIFPTTAPPRSACWACPKTGKR